MRAALLVLTAVVAGLWLSPVASAQRCQAPPGTAAIHQYCETIPAAGGDRTSDAKGQPAVPLSAKTAGELASSGKEGEQLLRSLGHDPQASAKSGGRSDRRPTASTATPPVPPAPSSNPLDAVRSAVTSGPSMGAGFFTVLVALTVLMAGFGWYGYRRRSTE